ncbi:MAG: dockerin type I domain-containing protein [Phycisphaeraceae bacterium]
MASSSPTIPIALTLLLGVAAPADDLAIVPFWDGETVEPFINRFGGSPLTFNTSLARSTAVRTSGRYGYRIATSIPQNDIGFVQHPLAPYGPTGEFATSRSLAGYQSVDFQLRNSTGDPFSLNFEIKDYRDGAGAIASYTSVIPASGTWQQVSIPLDLTAPGWSLSGIQPGTETNYLDRTKSLDLVIQANQGTAVNGSVYIDDMSLVEPGGPLDVATTPTHTLAERLAKRQWDALWGSRNRVNGLIPVHSTTSGHGAINATAAVVTMLPRAVDNGWVNPATADQYINTIVNSFNTIMDSADHAPGRYFNWTTLANDLVPEETNIDTAFLSLGLHRFANRPETSTTLRDDINTLQNRFDWDAFSDTTGPTRGWSLAYKTDTNQMTPGTYDSYSGEPWLISLAAHLSTDNHVPITEQYHSAIFRTKDHLVDPENEHLVSTFSQFRPPFTQWLMPLFADTSDRGNDTYPIPSLAGNPQRNATLYQQEVAAYFASIGRPFFLQPDAGADTDGSSYEQYSPYNDQGSPELFMPWSAAFALLGDEAAADAAIRHHLINNLEGPFGLSDAARWTTGANTPSEVRAFHDLWNTALSTMALFEYLYNDAAAFADLPDIAAALDKVFLPLVPGDFNRDGLVNADDIDQLTSQLGLLVADSALMYDLNTDGAVTAADYETLVTTLVDTSLGSATGALFGDTDLSGTVDLIDLSILATNFDSTGGWAQGDVNTDGLIDLIDLSFLASNFGQSITIPEPAALPLLALLMLRRRSH